ncbi:MAG: tetratricopeptide repeat protein [Bacteroidales bacterium]|nr:tetratricopeptide repeat protein [Bacteroidales bacterium]
MKMRSIILLLLFLSGPLAKGQYTDHRDHQLDSLEALVEPWTESRVATASPEQLDMLGNAYDDLMWGYAQINPSRSLHFARKSYALALNERWLNQAFQAAKMIGQHYWAAGQMDSAKASFDRALSIADRMALKEPLPGKPDGYKDATIDDAYSSLYGALGNLYADVDSIQVAMEYYRKAGEIFERNEWWESNSVLYHNMGETWLDAGNLKEAAACYDQALYFGREAEDSLLIAEAKAGLGALYLEQGRTGRALRLLQEADQYFSANENQEYRSRIYTLDLTGKVLAAQKRQSRTIAAGAVLLSLALITLVLILLRAVRLRKQKDAADVVIGEVLAERESPGSPSTGLGTAGNDARRDRADRPSLTDREKQILPLLAAGLSSKEIADRICLTEQTIKWYRMRLLEKMDARNTAGMLTRAKELGLL